jgi:uncharacterized membrane protein
MDTIGWIHLYSALVALAAGMWVVIRPKGTVTHRRVGWLYFASMLTLNVTALMIYRLTRFFGPFHVAALASLATLIIGIVPAWRRKPANWLDRHYYWMACSYLGLLAATVAETATRVPALEELGGGPSPAFWIVVVAASVSVFVVGGRFVKSRFERTVSPFRGRAK